MIKSHRELLVWQKSVDLLEQLYEISKEFPKSELFGLTSQIKRAALSIPSNIAEGRARGSRKDYRHFLILAFGSGAELESHIDIAKRLSFTTHEKTKHVEDVLAEVMRMLNAMIRKLQQS